MTRIFSDGAEFGDVLFWDAGTLPTASTAQKRSGNYSYSIGGEAIKNTSDYTEIYIRLGFYIVDGYSAYMVGVRHSTTILARIGVTDADHKINAYVSTSGTPVATGTHAFDANAWHLCEVYFKIGDNPDGKITVYVDGVLEIDYTGDTKPGADTHLDNIDYYKNSGSGKACYYDDLAADTATWCGDGHIELLTPNDNGDTNDWTGSDGDKVNNYLLVDDIPASGDDYNKSSTAAEQQMYKVTDFTDTGKIITRVWPECRAKDNDATSGQIKVGMKTASTHLSASAITLSGNYTRVVGDEETSNPADSTPWEDADLDSIQFVVECE